MSHWILMRGLAREARHWGDFPKRLATALEIDRGNSASQIRLLDLPGNGAFWKERSPSSVTDMVMAARAHLGRKGLAPPYKLLAMSLGGMVAAEWAQRFPEEVSALVMVNTSMRPFSRLSQRLRPDSWPVMLKIATRWNRPGFVEASIHMLTCERSALIKQDVVTWRGIRATAPVSRLNAARQLWAAARFSAARTAPACPVLVLSSKEDHLVDPACSAQLASAWAAQHMQHPWAGHDLPHDDAGWLANAVAKWARSRP